MNLQINSLLEWETENLSIETSRIERILYIEDTNGIVITIDIFSPTANPQIRYYKDLISAIDNQSIRILTVDPYAHMQTPEDQISQKYKNKRDKNWELISEIFELEGIKPYISSFCGKIIAKIEKRTGKARKDIYKYRRRYLQSGKIKNSLLPRYNKSGAPKKRRLGKSTDDTKLGKPSNKSQQTGRKTGIRITPAVEKKFLRGIKKFYDQKDKKKSLRKAFQKILEIHFNIGYEFKDEILIPILPPAEELPTFDQFRYWYEKHYYDAVRSTKNRYGKTAFNLKSRRLLGDATSIAFGPGSVYQIDATIGDIYLVSSLDRTKIVGRPVIYVVIDVFSRLIVGMSVLLEGPSWYGAMLALDNVVEDKVAYCAKHGITIQPDEWKGNALPERILGDRGELEGSSVESLTNSFGIIVQNTAPYRADWKSIVERHFGIATEKFIKYSPGGVIKARERGDKDYRLDAIYTLHEFESLVIAHILNYNEAHELKYYRKNEFQIADRVERFPNALWDWGMENRTGHLPVYQRDIVRLNLLPREEVSVTEHGIHFSQQLYYTCETAEREGWFERARIRGSWKIPIAYHPNSTNHIYLPTNDGMGVDICELTPASQAFANNDFFSIKDYYFEEAISSEDARDRVYNSDAKFNARHEHITKKAMEEKILAKYDAGPQSKKSQTEGIRDNRREERDHEREKNIWDLNETDPNRTFSTFKDEEPEQSEEIQEEDHYEPAPDYTDMLRDLLNEQTKK